MKWNIENLKKFSNFIATFYNKGLIKGPVHLSGSTDNKQEKNLIKIFKKYYKKGDWIFATYRNHFAWLLSGRNPNKLVQQIIDGHSMHVYDNKFFTSAIVGGHVPIAVGVALALKLKKSKNKVLCFLGDSAAHCGVVFESIKYSYYHKLPIIFIIEDNNRSVYTKTSDVWGIKNKDYFFNFYKKKNIIYYRYEPLYKHYGSRLEKDKNSGGLF